jgi:hypothetical protein
MKITSYNQAIQLLTSSGSVRLCDNKELFEHNPFPSIAFRLPDGRGAIVHHNLGRGYVKVFSTSQEAYARVFVPKVGSYEWVRRSRHSKTK